ncbi:MAG: phosphogluconate dehydrogenase C-terminal domain-containing protein [Limisphaerales bacterium]
MITIALLGAGGKMGCRIIDNLKTNPEYRLRPVEVEETGKANLARRGLTAIPQDQALTDAEVVILALPDRVLGKVAHEVVPKLRPDALVMSLDPAAAHAGAFPTRPDIAYFVTHPCHPPLFNYDATPEERRDFFGGVKAKQNIVCALQQGTDADYAKGQAVARAIFAPVLNAHRITVEQMAILEPAMAETVTACCITVIREAMDEAIRRGVPAAAARDFMMGHAHIPLAIVFGEINSPFSDGAKLIIEYGRQRLFRPDWKKLFEPESVKEQVQTIISGTMPPAPGS